MTACVFRRKSLFVRLMSLLIAFTFSFQNISFAVVEKEIRQGVEPAGALAALQQTMTTLLASLSVITHSQEPAAEGTAINAAELTPLLNTLQQLLEERNAAAVGLVAQIEPQLHDTDLKNRMQTISERINDFEFEDALQLLGELRGTLP